MVQALVISLVLVLNRKCCYNGKNLICLVGNLKSKVLDKLDVLMLSIRISTCYE